MIKLLGKVGLVDFHKHCRGGILPGSCCTEPFRLVEGAATRLRPSLGTGSGGGELVAALELNSV